MTRLLIALWLSSLLSITGVSGGEPHADHSHSPSVATGFLKPFEHIHSSEQGTPIVHSFGIEPAFTGRDLFFDYRYRSGEGFTENEIELELEWAFTSRLGVILEIPYVFEDSDGEPAVNGFGDLAIVPRALLFEGERVALTSQIEIVAPTGSDAIGGETAIAPGFASWIDLDNWWTLNAQLAVEHVFEDHETELIFGFGLVKSFGRMGEPLDAHGHGTVARLFHLHLEVTGSVLLKGEDKGDAYAEGLVGFSYGLRPDMDLRVGYEFPLTSPREFDSGIVAGVAWHF